MTASNSARGIEDASSHKRRKKKVTVTLEDVVLRRIHYEERFHGATREEPTNVPPTKFSAALVARSRTVIEFEFAVRATPRERDRQYGVYVVLGARFRRDATTEAADFVRFVLERAASLVLPYAREMISNITGRGIYGSLFIKPMTLEPSTMDRTAIRALAKYLNEMGDTAPPWSAASRLLPASDEEEALALMRAGAKV